MRPNPLVALYCSRADQIHARLLAKLTATAIKYRIRLADVR